tara:strand:+ start:1 stop:1470 length:1470 start_codon:yes stop_codon:yes gene_type:complete
MKQLLITIAALVLVGCQKSTEYDLRLIESSRIGDFNRAKKNISNGANVNAKDPTGGTALHAAAFNNHTNIIHLLIDSGANVNVTDNNGYTPADIARKDAAMVLSQLGGKESIRLKIKKDKKKLISKEENNRERNEENKNTATFKEIMRIASGSHNTNNVTDEVKGFLLKTSGIWEVRMKSGEKEGSMIEAPVFYSFSKIVEGKYLVRQFLQPNGLKLRTKVIFHNANNSFSAFSTAKDGFLNESKILIDEANKTFREDSEKLQISSDSFNSFGSYSHNKIRTKVKYLKNNEVSQLYEYELTKVGDSNFKLNIDSENYVSKKGEKRNPEITIWEASGKGDIKILKEHLSNGANVNSKQGFSGWSPLTIASQNGRLNAAVLLLLNGADVNSIGLRSTALSEAGGNYFMNKLLLANGADPEIKIGGPRNTVLHRASLMGRVKIIELLIAYGAKVNSTDYLGETPLDKARGKTASLLRKHSGKTKKELEAEEK